MIVFDASGNIIYLTTYSSISEKNTGDICVIKTQFNITMEMAYKFKDSVIVGDSVDEVIKITIENSVEN